MKYLFTLTIGALASVFLASCATPNDPIEAYEARRGANNVQTSNPIVDAASKLTARNLARGECGLFVWSADQERRFILFSQAQTDKATWAGPTGETSLVIVEKSGQEFQQQFTQQGFAERVASDAGAAASTLSLSLRNIEELIDSTRFKAGTLSQTMDDGLERVMPVVGLSTCR